MMKMIGTRRADQLQPGDVIGHRDDTVTVSIEGRRTVKSIHVDDQFPNWLMIITSRGRQSATPGFVYSVWAATSAEKCGGRSVYK